MFQKGESVFWAHCFIKLDQAGSFPLPRYRESPSAICMPQWPVSYNFLFSFLELKVIHLPEFLLLSSPSMTKNPNNPPFPCCGGDLDFEISRFSFLGVSLLKVDVNSWSLVLTLEESGIGPSLGCVLQGQPHAGLWTVVQYCTFASCLAQMAPNKTYKCETVQMQGPV